MDLKGTFREIRKELKAKDEIREKVLALSRKIVRTSARAIFAIHKEKFNLAKRRIKSARNMLNKLEELLKECPELERGMVTMAYQEYSEANLFLSFSLQMPFPSYKELKVPSSAYILGLSDTVGELRRKALDSIRKGDIKTAERCLRTMEEIYDSFLIIDVGHALIPDFRPKVDLIRRRLEETRGDLSIASILKRRVGKT